MVALRRRGLRRMVRRSAATPAADADALVTEFVYQSLALSPVSASAAGYHVHEKLRLDAALGRLQCRRVSPSCGSSIASSCIASTPCSTRGWTPSGMADLDIIRDAVNLKLLELDRIQDFRHNPTVYVELIGNGLYTPFVLNYAPPEVRFQDLIGRLQAIAGAGGAGQGQSGGRARRVEPRRPRGERRQHRTHRQDAARARARRAARGLRQRGRTRAAVAPGSQQFPGHDAVGQDQRLAPGQGELRSQVPLHAAHRPHARSSCWPPPRRTSPRRARKWRGWPRRAR